MLLYLGPIPAKICGPAGNVSESCKIRQNCTSSAHQTAYFSICYGQRLRLGTISNPQTPCQVEHVFQDHSAIAVHCDYRVALHPLEDGATYWIRTRTFRFFSGIKLCEVVSIVIAVINGIEISHNYLRQKMLRRPLHVRNCQCWAVYISVAKWIKQTNKQWIICGLQGQATQVSVKRVVEHGQPCMQAGASITRMFFFNSLMTPWLLTIY